MSLKKDTGCVHVFVIAILPYLLDLALQMQQPLTDLNTFGLWKVNIFVSSFYSADSSITRGVLLLRRPWKNREKANINSRPRVSDRAASGYSFFRGNFLMDSTSQMQMNIFLSIHLDLRNDNRIYGDTDYKIAQKQPGERLRGGEKNSVRSTCTPDSVLHSGEGERRKRGQKPYKESSVIHPRLPDGDSQISRL